MHFGDTAFGQLVRVASGGTLFSHCETKSSLPTDWLESKAESGASDAHSDGASAQIGVSGAPDWMPWAARWIKRSRTPSSSTSQASGVDDSGIIGDNGFVRWYGDQDPDNPQNWSSTEKAVVAGLICLYTFSVYLGSAIYTPSVMGVMLQFNVSYAAASLGLALFVFGCKSMTICTALCVKILALTDT